MSNAVHETEPTLPAEVTRLYDHRERSLHVRATRGMSCAKLAEECGLTTRDVKRLERISPSDITLVEILFLARGLNVHPAWLAYGVGEMGPYPFDRRATWPDPMPVPPHPPESDASHDVVRRCVLDHPLPWRVERDCGYEVTAEDGTIIAQCKTPERADAVIALAERIQSTIDAGAAQMERATEADPPDSAARVPRGART